MKSEPTEFQRFEHCNARNSNGVQDGASEAREGMEKQKAKKKLSGRRAKKALLP